MMRRIGFPLVGALLLVASTAQAQEAAPPPATMGVTGNPFGAKGQIVLSDVPPLTIPVFSNAVVGFGSPGSPSGTIGYLNFGGSGEFVLGLEPALDYFAMDHISVGGGLGFTFVSSSGSSVTAINVIPRAGYQIPATQAVSVWPRLGLDLSVVSAGGSSNTNFGVAIDAPVLYHVSDHFFFGGAPTLTVGLTGDNKLTAFTIDFILGGWL
jgi:hypothetical protein